MADPARFVETGGIIFYIQCCERGFTGHDL
jgi:hypothetical protein